MNEAVDHGTPERQKKSDLKLEARDVAQGGTIINTGLRDRTPTKLDWYKTHGLLGNAMESERRYQTGMRLWALYTAFGDTHGAPVIEAMQGGGAYQRFVQEREIGQGSDIAETLFKNITRSMKDSLALTWSVCIDGALNWPQAVCVHAQYVHQVNKALDMLESVMESKEQELKNALEE